MWLTVTKNLYKAWPSVNFNLKFRWIPFFKLDQYKFCAISVGVLVVEIMFYDVKLNCSIFWLDCWVLFGRPDYNFIIKVFATGNIHEGSFKRSFSNCSWLDRYKETICVKSKYFLYFISLLTPVKLSWKFYQMVQECLMVRETN